LYLDLSTGTKQTSLGFAQLQELYVRIQMLKQAKRSNPLTKDFKAIAFTDTFNSQAHYYLATAFDEIHMEQTGSLPLTGFSSSQPFFKTLLTKLGLEVQAHAEGDYKSMISPMTKDEWPKKQLENMMNLFSSLNTQLKTRISHFRNDQNVKDRINPTELETISLPNNGLASVQDIMHLAPMSAVESLQQKLVTHISYKRNFIPIDDKFTNTAGNRVMELRKYKQTRCEELEKEKSTTLPLIAIVYLVGTITRGDNVNQAGAISKALLTAAHDKNVVDSGGGDAIASDSIWETVHHISKELKKPVVASYGNVSASGGVYASSACDRILCSPGTITGSIGVAQIKPIIPEETLKSYGINMNEIHFSEGSKNSSFLRKLEGVYWERLKIQSQNMYNLFKKRVADGRNLDLDYIQSVAQGQVWTGVQAREKKLVDKLGNSLSVFIIGGFDDAIVEVKKLALQNALAEAETIVFPKRLSWWEQLVDAGNPDKVASYMKGIISVMIQSTRSDFETKSSTDLKMELDQDVVLK
ncbi:hypothetical protein HDV02_003999, partial [Globomyces sp. JEL0801]